MPIKFLDAEPKSSIRFLDEPTGSQPITPGNATVVEQYAASRPRSVLATTAPLTAQALGDAQLLKDMEGMGIDYPGDLSEGDKEVIAYNGAQATKMLRNIAVLGASLAVPPLGVGLRGAALTGAAGGLAGGLTKQVVGGGEGDLKERAVDVATDTLAGGVGGVVLGTAAKAAAPALRGLFSIPIVSKVAAALTPRGLAARALAPAEERIANAAANRGRDVIEAATGERPPIGIGEAIGSPDVVRSLKVVPEGAEPTPEAMEALKRNVLFSASRLGGIGLSADDIAADALGTLRSQVGEVSGKVVKATEDLAKTYATKLADATADIQSEAGKIFPDSGASSKALGERLKDKAQAAFQATKAQWDDLYAKARELPEFKAPVIEDNGRLAQWENDVLGATVQTKNGSPGVRATETGMFDEFGPITAETPAEGTTKAIASALPEGTAKYVKTIGQMSGVPQSVEALKNLRTQVADSISDTDVLPGLGAARKKQLVGILTGMIQNGVDKLPSGELKTALTTANQFYAANVDRFQGALASGILRDTGKAAGKAPESVAGLFSGTQGASNLETVRNLLGGSAAEGDAIIREHLLNEIGQGAKDPFGQFSVKKLVSSVNNLSPEVRAVVLPNSSNLTALAEREAQRSGLPEAKKFAEALTLDQSTMQQVLGAGGAKEVEAALKTAVAAKAAEAKVFRNQVLKDIAAASPDTLTRNPGAFIDGIFNGNFSPAHVRGAMDLIARESPQVAEQVQFRYLDRLLNEASGKNGIDSAMLSRLLGKPGPTSSGGAASGTAEAILGVGRTETLRKLADAFASVDKASGSRIGQDSSALEGILRGAGLVAGATDALPKMGPASTSNLLGWIARKSRETRYAVAASLLTDQNLRRIASKPLSQVTKDEMREIIATSAKLLAGAGAAEGTLADLAESAAGLHDNDR